MHLKHVRPLRYRRWDEASIVEKIQAVSMKIDGCVLIMRWSEEGKSAVVVDPGGSVKIHCDGSPARSEGSGRSNCQRRAWSLDCLLMRFRKTQPRKLHECLQSWLALLDTVLL